MERCRHAGFVAGEVGQAFSFDGSSGYVSVPDAPTLDSFTNAMTIECWIKSGQLAANPGWEGLVCKGNASWRLQGTSGAKTVTFSVTGTTVSDLFGTRNVNDRQWHHVAGVYDGAKIYLYVDGTLDVSQASTGAITQTSDLLTIGNNLGQPGLLWNGLMDEVSLYNRALSAGEIAAIYNAGGAGKCVGTPPTITTQPTNQTVTVGGTATFAVVATGTSPLSYQWSVNNTNIADATNASLTLANVQLNQAGGYSVVVSNAFGSTNSVTATLTVTGTPPSTTAQPTNQTVNVGEHSELFGSGNRDIAAELSVEREQHQYCECHQREPDARQRATEPGGRLLGGGQQCLRINQQHKCDTDSQYGFDLRSTALGVGELVASRR